MTAVQAARAVGANVITVQRWLRFGAVPEAVRQGRQWRLTEAAVSSLRKLVEARRAIAGKRV
jgi:predicted site-specific integrase-resolvase